MEPEEKEVIFLNPIAIGTTPSHIIELPNNPIRKRQLELKRREYMDRVPDTHPGQIFLHDFDLGCRIRGLEIILRDGTLNTHDLSLELVREYPDSFREKDFNQAMGIIADYVKTGGANTVPGTGTGLPFVEADPTLS